MRVNVDEAVLAKPLELDHVEIHTRINRKQTHTQIAQPASSS